MARSNEMNASGAPVAPALCEHGQRRHRDRKADGVLAAQQRHHEDGARRDASPALAAAQPREQAHEVDHHRAGMAMNMRAFAFGRLHEQYHFARDGIDLEVFE